MSKRFWGSINLNTIKEAIQSGIEPFEGKKGKYVPITVWVEDEPDKFGNSLSITMYNKDKKESFYLANLKEAENDKESIGKEVDDDLPF